MHFFIDVQDLTSAPQSGIEPSFHSVFRQRGPIDHRICQAHVIIAVTFATCRTVLVLPYFSSQQSRNIMLSGKFLFVIELPPQVIVTGIRITREQMSPTWNMISQRTVIIARCKFVEDGTHHIGIFLVILIGFGMVSFILEFQLQIQILGNVEIRMQEQFQILAVGLLDVMLRLFRCVEPHIVISVLCGQLFSQHLIINITIHRLAIVVVKTVIRHGAGISHSGSLTKLTSVETGIHP